MKKNLYLEDLTVLDYEKRDMILLPSRNGCYSVEDVKELNEFLGQDKEIWVKDIGKVRFNYHLVVTHNNEVYLYIDGYMSGGIEVHKDLDKFINDDFHNRQWPEVINLVKREVNKIRNF